MRKISTLACFLLIFSKIIVSAQSPRIGTEYKDIHEIGGFAKKGSTVISLHYGVFHVQSDDKRNDYLVASRFVDSQQGDNDFKLRIVDVVEVPSYREEYFFMCLKGCKFNGKADDTLFALVVSEEKKVWTNIIRAWKLNRQTGVIEPFLQKGITCYNNNML